MKGEIDRGERVPAPLLFGVLLRMCLLHCDAVRMLAQVPRPLVGRQRRGEGRIAAGALRAGSLAGNEVDRVARQIVQPGARALIRVGDRTSAL
jgi:hypothetical protein